MKAHLQKLIVSSLFFLLVNTSFAQWQPMNNVFGCYSFGVVKSGNNFVISTENGIYLSTDSCKTWSLRSQNFYNYFFSSIVAIGNNVFASSSKGLVYSNDNGENWALHPAIKSSVFEIVACKNQLFFFADSGIYTSDNIGANLMRLKQFNSINHLSSNDSAVFVQTSKVVFSYTVSSAKWDSVSSSTNPSYSRSFVANSQFLFNVRAEGFFRSSDKGKNWNKIQITGNDSMLNYITCMNSVIFVSDKTGNLYKSIDNGDTWFKTYSFTNYLFNLSHSENNLFVCVNNVLYWSKDYGVSFQSYSKNVTNAYCGKFISINDNLIIGSSPQPYLSKNKGLSWQSSFFLPGRFISDMKSFGDNIYLATDSGVYISTDKGATFSNKSSGIKNKKAVQHILLRNQDLFAATLDAVYYSSDNGNSWQIDTVGIGKVWSQILVMDKKNLYRNYYSMKGAVYKSSNNGTSWNKSAKGLEKQIVTDMYVHNEKVFAGTSKGIYFSDDEGENWKDCNNGLPDSVRTDRLVEVKGAIFLSTLDDGVFEFIDSTGSWKNVTDGLNVMISDLILIDDYVLAATQGSGVWKRKASELGINTSIVGIKLENYTNAISLFPNPSNGEIIVTSKGLGKELITVFDVLGKEVFQKQFENIEKKSIDLSGLLKGLYFLELKDKSGAYKQKVILE